MAKREQGSEAGAHNDNALAVFENFKIRRVYDEKTETWYFSVVDIIAALIQQPDYQTARKYWNKLKERLKKEGSQSVTNCHRLKLEAADGKKYLTDVADTETLLRLIQSVPSPKAEPIKLWLAKVGHERMQDMGDPARSLDRAREYGPVDLIGTESNQDSSKTDSSIPSFPRTRESSGLATFVSLAHWISAFAEMTVIGRPRRISTADS